MNSVNLIGRLGEDPELKYTNNGMAVCRFSLAIDRRSKEKKITDWFEVVAFQRTAEIVSQYCSKGGQVGVEGKLQQERWENKDGIKRSKVVVVLDQLNLLGSKSNAKASDGWSEPDNSDEIPF